MPFGLTNALATFQAAITMEFRDLLDRTVLVDLDDISVYSRTLDEHPEHLRAVLEWLRIAKYKANRDKCEFAQQELEYLGHYVTPQGIRPLANKVQAIQDWSDLKCTTDIRSFLGLASYYMRFVKGFQRIAAPLSRLQSPLVPFEFSDEARHAFHTLKAALLQAPVLSIYDPTLPTKVTTDASGYGIGAVLEQHDGTNWHPVEYFSQKRCAEVEVRWEEVRLAQADVRWAEVTVRGGRSGGEQVGECRWRSGRGIPRGGGRRRGGDPRAEAEARWPPGGEEVGGGREEMVGGGGGEVGEGGEEMAGGGGGEVSGGGGEVGTGQRRGRRRWRGDGGRRPRGDGRRWGGEMAGGGGGWGRRKAGAGGGVETAKREEREREGVLFESVTRGKRSVRPNVRRERTPLESSTDIPSSSMAVITSDQWQAMLDAADESQKPLFQKLYDDAVQREREVEAAARAESIVAQETLLQVPEANADQFQERLAAAVAALVRLRNLEDLESRMTALEQRNQELEAKVVSLEQAQLSAPRPPNPRSAVVPVSQSNTAHIVRSSGTTASAGSGASSSSGSAGNSALVTVPNAGTSAQNATVLTGDQYSGPMVDKRAATLPSKYDRKADITSWIRLLSSSGKQARGVEESSALSTAREVGQSVAGPSEEPGSDQQLALEAQTNAESKADAVQVLYIKPWEESKEVDLHAHMKHWLQLKQQRRVQGTVELIFFKLLINRRYISVLIGSGSTTNFFSPNGIRKADLGMKQVELQNPCRTQVGNQEVVTSTHVVKGVRITFDKDRTVTHELNFYVLDKCPFNAVIGLGWLKAHCLRTTWADNQLVVLDANGNERTVLLDETRECPVTLLSANKFCSKSMEEHVKHLEEVLQVLKDAQLHLNLEKSKFGKDSVIYLGHRLSASGLPPEATKVEVIRNWPQPANVRELRSFLGLASYYRKFVPKFSVIAHPLSRLTSKNVAYTWCEKCETAFQDLKEALVSHPVLRIADPNLTFIVTTDASQFGIGAVLQQDDGDGLRPLEYYSKRMPSHKVATSTYMRELYSLCEALTHWKHYLLGRHFKVYSDHQTLQWIKTQTDLSPTLSRWLHDIDVFNFELKHKKGCYNRVADALSRHPEYLTCLVDSYDLRGKQKEDMVEQTAKDPDLSPILEQLKADPNSQPDFHECEGLVDRRYGKFDRLCVPNHAPLRTHFLDLAHDRSGHFGFEKTYGSLLQQFDWPGMKGFAQKFIAECQYGWPMRNPLSYLFPERSPGLMPGMHGYNAKYARLLKVATTAMNKRQHAMIKHANKLRKEEKFKVGDYVWVKMSEFSDEEGISRKLLPLYYGPWQILKVVGDEFGPSYVIDVPPRLRTYPVFHASKLFPHIDDETFPFRDPMIPRPIDGGHEIDRIISHEGRGRNRQYKVRFLYHPLNEFFWIDRNELIKSPPRVVNAYERQIVDGQTSKFAAKLTPFKLTNTLFLIYAYDAFCADSD
ncbi:hypothetical protein CBR_g3373 [Chara braunii]|uniref:Reverse transcriptase domain-containing protein n=1 Tax=Chara braunii TaxID=69332 RepID=A0A388JQM6_CHABU|nr:hypothetical protein CBR_g3373 [Chara braunii]|eukprot:GBG60129.1 hypothetical protein CBR_g3373 [Chara braunii]